MSDTRPFMPNYAIPPGASIGDALQTARMSEEEFQANMGLNRAQQTALMQGALRIDFPLALKLKQALGYTARFWMRRDSQYVKNCRRLGITPGTVMPAHLGGEPVMRIGICGAHRTGKTTLARALARRLKVYYLKHHSAPVFKRERLSADTPMDFDHRFHVQKELLKDGSLMWERHHDGEFITDRCPIDYLGYTLADIQGSTQTSIHMLDAYQNECFDNLNRYFTHLVLLQPGIPVVPAEGKAPLNEAYMMHLNALMIGATSNPRCQVSTAIVPEEVITVEERSDFVTAWFNLERNEPSSDHEY